MNRNVDWLIVTAANEMQSRGYRAQLEARQRRGQIDFVNHWRVIADPGGRRVGSGGSTLWVLHEIARELRKQNKQAKSLAELFAGQRVLIIHSGGDSRRLVAYAAQGKVFTPLPCDVPGRDEHPATLFDLILSDLAGLPSPEAGQVLLAAGDVLLTFDPLAVDFNQPGIVGVAYAGPAARGEKHGVYVADANSQVTDFLQKPTEAEARQRGAVDQVGRVLVDTGLVSLDPPTVNTWLNMAGVSLGKQGVQLKPGLLKDVVNGKSPAIDLYEQMLMAVPAKQKRNTYLKAMQSSKTKQAGVTSHHKRLEKLYDALHDLNFHVNVLPTCEFFHIGTTRELVENISGLNRTAQHYHFANLDRSVIADSAALEGAFIYNSVLESQRIRVGKRALIEAGHANGVEVELPGDNVVVGWPKEAKQPLRLPEGVGLVCLPIGERDWSVVMFGCDDDFKTSIEAGGTGLNQPLDQLLKDGGLDADSIWKSDESSRTLWSAKLWRVGPINQVLKQTTWLARSAAGETVKPPKPWLKAKRLSMAELLGMVNHERLIAAREELQRLGELNELSQRLLTKPNLPADHVVSQLRSIKEAEKALSQIDQLLARDQDPLLHARLFRLAELIADRFKKTAVTVAGYEKSQWSQAAYSAVAESVARDLAIPDEPVAAAILHDQVCWATTPVRIDFAGGWSDTPPICAEVGGTVVNAAVTLNGQYPLQVVAKLTEKRSITLSSIDLGRSEELTQTRDILRYTDPGDWAALPKAALVLAGLCPRDAKQKLTDWLEILGGGLNLTLFSSLPKGSGMGTSSILGAAVLACLARVVGRPVSNETLISQVSMLEQMMTTGGGWQDQVGGITPGVKIVRTVPGPDQNPSLHWTGVDLTERSPLKRRMLLYFTGQKRLAKNILQNVVGRYLARDPQSLAIIDQLKASAEQMKDDLDRGDAEAFAQGIDQYWQLKKAIDPGSTNLGVEKIIKKVDKYLSAKLLPGAGGGGFVFMVAKDEEAAEKVRFTLDKQPPNPHSRFFDFQIDPQGLKVTVL